MMMEIKNCWFALKSNVYVEFKEGNMLLYDTEHGENVETKKKENIALIAQLYEPKNLGVIQVKEELQTDIRLFIQEVIDKDMGELIEITPNSPKPIRLIPILNLQKDIDKHQQHEDKIAFLGKDINKYLLELNVYLNDSCDSRCTYCNDYNKQILCCMSNNNGNELSIEKLQKVFEQIHYSPIRTINLLGGNIFKYTHLEELNEISKLYPQMLHYHIHYENYQQHEFIDSQKLELIITFPLKKMIFQNVWQQVNQESTRIHFIVDDENQCCDVENLISLYNIKEYKLHPFFTGENIGFFNKNIFLDREDVFSTTTSMREIFRNQKLNANFFGTLYILSDGTVKANMNASILGNIDTDDILDLIYKEMLDNTAWRTTRNSTPCNECIYQFICPPLSNYERAIGQSNLCNIK